MYLFIYSMISEEVRVERLRQHKELKQNYERKLDNDASDSERNHLEARIAEVVRDVKATELPKPKAILPKITKTTEDAAKTAEEHIVQPLEQKPAKPGRESNKVKQVGNPF